MSLNASRNIVRYSNSFKLMVVKEIEEGQPLEYTKNKYGISGSSTIQNWINKFGKYHLLNKIIRVETMTEKQRLKQLEQENKQLKIKLAETYMIKDCLEEVINLANEEYRTDLKKNYGTPLPADSKGNTV